MALSSLGSLILQLLVFITTLVNLSHALENFEPVLIIVLYAVSRIFVTPPEEGMFSKWPMEHLYSKG
jgi:hypothetical protein